MSLFFGYFKQYLKTRLAYRWDVAAQFFTDLLFQAVNLIFILVIFAHTQQLNGWSQGEVLFIYGYFLVPWSIFVSFVNLWAFNERYIIKGELDRVLTRPVHSLQQVMMENMTPESLLGVINGVIVMIWGLSTLDVTWSWYDPLLLIFFLLGGVCVYAGISIAMASISLYSDSKTDIQPIIFNIGNYGRYPINLYHRVIQLMLTWVLPFAFVGFYPASFLLDRTEWQGIALLTPVVGLVYLGLGVLCWNRGIRHYRGAGN
jgi:ABC-2 type transport system permease protein